ncbi:hypothetical protein BC835DRAFT_1320253 [Cytidiella melzeri]|nr:hypothetical protein BC835DRAFT_1320253 [Cytidiella melzeri]
MSAYPLPLTTCQEFVAACVIAHCICHCWCLPLCILSLVWGTCTVSLRNEMGLFLHAYRSGQVALFTVREVEAVFCSRLVEIKFCVQHDSSAAWIIGC